MTVNAWFDFWITNIKEKTTRHNTVRNYRERYEHNIRDVIGNMIISEVKPMHCQHVLNLMKDDYKGSTIQQCRITMASMFFYAMQNQIISSSPVTKSVKLQTILGHSTLAVTMNTYVHITEDEKEKEMKKFEEAFKIS